MGLALSPVNMTNEASTVEMTFESNLKYVEVAEDVVRRVCATAGFEEEEEHKIEIRRARIVDQRDLAWQQERSGEAGVAEVPDFRRSAGDSGPAIRGNGFESGSRPDPLESNLLKVSGRGIFLIRAYVDEFRVRIWWGMPGPRSSWSSDLINR